MYNNQNTLENSLGSHHIGANFHLSINLAWPAFPPMWGHITISPVRFQMKQRFVFRGSHVVTLPGTQLGPHTQRCVGPEGRAWLGAGALQSPRCAEFPYHTISPFVCACGGKSECVS